MRRSYLGIIGLVTIGVSAIAFMFPTEPMAAFQPQLRFGDVAGVGATEAGELNTPVSIEVGPSGDIYVGDSGNNRLNQYLPDGTFTRAWGWNVAPGNPTGFESCTIVTGCQNGSADGGAGELASVDGISAAANGDLFVTDSFHHRVSQFTSTGTFIRAWGRDVAPPDGDTGFEICTADPPGCLPGDFGSGPGELNQPNSVAVSGTNVYVTETIGARVSQFTTSGTPGVPPSFGGFGSGAGQLSGPRGVAIAPGGNVLVADNGNNRVSEFTAAGSFVRAWGFDVVPGGGGGLEVCTSVAPGCQAGTGGGAAGQLSDSAVSDGASGIATNAAGTIFLTDDGNNRIAQYTATPAFSRAWGFDVDPTGGTGFENCTSASGCTPATACPLPTSCLGFGQLDNPTDLNVDSSGRLLVVDFATRSVTRYVDPMPPVTPPTDPPSSDPDPSDPTDPEPGDPPAEPSNEIGIGKAKLNLRKGSAKLPVEVLGAGQLKLEGKGVKPVSKDVNRASTIALPVKPKGKRAKQLEESGAVKVSLVITFTPDGGDANSETKSVKLKLK